MGIQRLQQVNGGIDWSKYSDLSGAVVVTPGDTGFRTMLDITGKGFIKKLIGYRKSGASQGAVSRGFIRITIDGLVVFEANMRSYVNSSPPNTIGYSGLICEEHILGFDTSVGIYSKGLGISRYYASMSVINSLPYSEPEDSSGNAYGKIFILSKPLFFNQNLKVEMRCIDTQTKSMVLDYLGGVEI